MSTSTATPSKAQPGEQARAQLEALNGSDPGPHSRPQAQATARKRKIPRARVDSRLDAHARYLDGGTGRGDRRACFVNRDLDGYYFWQRIERAQFHGATLTGCRFQKGVDVAETDFSGADLSGVDLSEVVNLGEQRLGAANLQYTRLPAGFVFEGIAAIRDLSGRAEKLILTLLASCATVLALTWVSSDDQLFLPSATLNLPVLGMEVPIRAFYYLAPWLLLAPYIFLLSTVHQLWATLRDVPALLPSGRAVFREVSSYPNFCVMPFGTLWPDHHKRGEELAEDQGNRWRRTTRWDRIQVSALVWFLVPLTIAAVWLSYLPRHGRAGTVLEGSAVLLAFGLSLRSYFMMRISLSRGMQWIKRPNPAKGRRLYVGGIRFVGGFVQPQKARRGRDGLNNELPKLVWRRYWTAVTIAATGVALFSLAAIKLTWCDTEIGRRNDSPNRCYMMAAFLEDADFRSLELDAVNLRRAWLREANLSNADLEDAELQGANLTEAKLRGTRLKDAHLENAIFWEADLSGANLKEAHLEGADLRGANLTGASLQGVHLAGANLLGAQMEGTILCGAELADEHDQNSAVITAAQRQAAVGSAYLRRGRDSVIDRGSLDPQVLGDSSRREQFKWLHAYQDAKRLRSSMFERSFSRRAALLLLRGMNVSMGQATERRLVALEEAVRNAPSLGSDPDRIRLDAHAYVALQGFIKKVKEKAQNHCVWANDLKTLPDRVVPTHPAAWPWRPY